MHLKWSSQNAHPGCSYIQAPLADCFGQLLYMAAPMTSCSRACWVPLNHRSSDKPVCNTPQGAYTCQGPQSGGVVCPKCVSTPNSILSSNNSSTFNTPGHSSSNPTNEYDQQG
ncbi:hypothetical protein PGTUg99_018065 [Puccinia graminis f. sp. tritici]|uniref:Uncharacterized protein n=1 Tax=Puccinia graminis f. sp. tritici TaxID=56615 RepID=A0A5B0MZ35_PUCGR|nr:hypothetical protein PGTUg99_018065 [Puccinia graminis f. sp. tritici]